VAVLPDAAAAQAAAIGGERVGRERTNGAVVV
jgi:hypothetical protein